MMQGVRETTCKRPGILSMQVWEIPFHNKCVKIVLLHTFVKFWWQKQNLCPGGPGGAQLPHKYFPNGNGLFQNYNASIKNPKVRRGYTFSNLTVLKIWCMLGTNQIERKNLTLGAPDHEPRWWLIKLRDIFERRFIMHLDCVQADKEFGCCCSS